MWNKAKKYIERLYNDMCTVYERQEYLKENKTTAYKDVAVIENMPCRISYEKTVSNALTDKLAYKSQGIKLFYSAECHIKAGSRIMVLRNGVTTAYRASGEPAVYNTHNEIMLELWDVIS